MYLKSLTMKNFRKYGEENNTANFVKSKGLRTESEEKREEDNAVNVASATTLVVGKNNAGKSSVIQALLKLVNKEEKHKLKVSDFNFYYLKDVLKEYIAEYKKNKANENVETLDAIKPPFMEFIVSIGLEAETNDVVTNMIPFMLIEDAYQSEVNIYMRYEVIEESEYKKKIYNMFKKMEVDGKEGTPGYEEILFKSFLKCLDETKFQINYYRDDAKEEKIQEKFKLSNVVDITCINANNVTNPTCLTDAFNKIVKYRYEHEKLHEKANLENTLERTNEKLGEQLKKDHDTEINNVVGKIVSDKKMSVALQPDITLNSFMDKMVRYEYVEKGLNIPEDQFGMGYTHLVMIIATLIEYMDHYPSNPHNSKINLIAIEEPEVFMHPQMQELFIKNIDEAIRGLLNGKQKNINSQLIVTTHSSHILNSKIHSGNSFDDIVYVYEKEPYAVIRNLEDESVVPEAESDADFKFLKKHMKYKVSELFFCDAVILVEGFAEETILPFYLEDSELAKYYISVFSINGAHAYLYEKLLLALGVPALIITDLDIRREEESLSQISDISDKETTNRTIMHFNGRSNKLSNSLNLRKENIKIVHQGQIEGYYATSFEEACILTNWDNDIVNEILKEMKPGIYERIVGKPEAENRRKNVEKSYEWQVKLEKEKGEFASKLLYSLVNNEDEDTPPKVPAYIEGGFRWLENMLKGETDERTGD